MKFTTKKLKCVLMALVLVAPMAAAQSVSIANAWARATAPGQKTAGVYLDLRSNSDTAVVAAGSPLAAGAELHSMTMQDGVMRMRPLPRIDLPAGRTVRLAPNGMHLMLVGLKRELKAGEKLPIVLSLQSSGTSLTTLAIEAEVRALDGAPAPHSH